jgi:hypothetical protein
MEMKNNVKKSEIKKMLQEAIVWVAIFSLVYVVYMKFKILFQ